MNGDLQSYEQFINQDLEHKLAATLNQFSAENASNTPDWILAQFLLGCLAAWNQGIQQRGIWYGRSDRSGRIASVTPPTPPDGIVGGY